MYKKKKITYPPCFSEDSSLSCEYNPFVDKVVVARPMSYYLNGGVDLMDMASTMASESESRALKDGAREPNSD